MTGLPEKLLDKLACPKCKGRLTYREQKAQLECHHCKLSYPIKEGIPVLLVDEAKALR